MVNNKDTILNQLPSFIVEDYPRFVAFVEAYYEWLNENGNPEQRIKDHTNALAFEESVDEYVDFMMQEFLTKIPQNVFGNKELFIKWSKKLNLSRGSHESYKFLFRLLFNEQTTEIYLPKENILKPSDGTWVSGQHTILVTNSGDPERFLYKRIFQEKPIYNGIVEYAYATVESYRIRYNNGFNLIELYVSNIVGEFESDFLIQDEEGNSEWPIETISGFEIVDPGQSYFNGTRLSFTNWDQTFTKDVDAEEDGIFDTRCTTFLQKDQITIIVNGYELPISAFEYDGRYITSNQITSGDYCVFSISIGYEGYISIGEVDNQGMVTEVQTLDTPIGTQENLSMTAQDSFGSGLDVTAFSGVIREIPGYYLNQKGFLSANMYLQDSNYYQDYSYVIKTEQDIRKYADVVKDVLHPAGFKLFGNVRILDVLNAIIGVSELDSGTVIQNAVVYSLSRYTLGANHSLLKRIGSVISPRTYNPGDFNQQYIDGDVDYNLEDDSLERTYDDDGIPLVINKKGWMAKHNFADFDHQQPNDYFEHDAFEYYYMEPSYVLTNDMDEQAFINTYINVYSVFDYSDKDYSFEYEQFSNKTMINLDFENSVYQTYIDEETMIVLDFINQQYKIRE